MANGAFGQVRIITDNNTNEELAVKLENSNAKMPMLFLEYRFYKVSNIQMSKGSLFVCFLVLYSIDIDFMFYTNLGNRAQYSWISEDSLFWDCWQVQCISDGIIRT